MTAKGHIAGVADALRRTGETTSSARANLISALDGAVGEVHRAVKRAPLRQESLLAGVRRAAAKMSQETDSALTGAVRRLTDEAGSLEGIVEAWEQILVTALPGGPSTPAALDMDGPTPRVVVPATDSSSSALPPAGKVLAGRFNTNIVVHTNVGIVVLRKAKKEAPDSPGTAIVVPPSPWDEGDLLARIGTHLPFVPRLLHSSDSGQVHKWIAGEHVEIVPRTVLPEHLAPLAAEIGARLARVAAVPLESLPGLPDDWPSDGDCVGYAKLFLRPIEGTWPGLLRRYASLYEAIGVPDEPFSQLRVRLGELASRPFGLLHSDLHWGNILLAPEPVFLDWGFASFGDPLADVALHLEKWPYHSETAQQALVTRWARDVGPERSRDYEQDLPTLRLLHRAWQAVGTPHFAVLRARQAAFNGPSAVKRAVDEDAVAIAFLVNRVNRQLWGAQAPLEPAFVAERLFRMLEQDAAG